MRESAHAHGVRKMREDEEIQCRKSLENLPPSTLPTHGSREAAARARTHTHTHTHNSIMQDREDYPRVSEAHGHSARPER